MSRLDTRFSPGQDRFAQTQRTSTPLDRRMSLGKPIKPVKPVKPARIPNPTNSGQPIAGTSQSSIPTSPSSVISDILNAPPAGQFTKTNTRDPTQLFLDATNRANASNDARFKQAIGLLAGQGQSSRTDAARATAENKGLDQQSLISRGLGSTTVLDAANRRRDEDLQRANQRIDESVANQVSGIVERRTDQGPDLGSLAGLLQQQSAANAQDKAQSKKTRSLVTAPRTPNTFGQPGSGGGGGAGGAGVFGGGGGGGGSGGAQGVQTFTNQGRASGQNIRATTGSPPIVQRPGTGSFFSSNKPGGLAPGLVVLADGRIVDGRTAAGRAALAKDASAKFASKARIA